MLFLQEPERLSRAIYITNLAHAYAQTSQQSATETDSTAQPIISKQLHLAAWHPNRVAMLCLAAALALQSAC